MLRARVWRRRRPGPHRDHRTGLRAAVQGVLQQAGNAKQVPGVCEDGQGVLQRSAGQDAAGSAHRERPLLAVAQFLERAGKSRSV